MFQHDHSGLVLWRKPAFPPGYRGGRWRAGIFNTDQGSQFTGNDFLDVLRVHRVAISMDRRGRFSDNIFVERLWRSLKYEEVVCCESFIGDGGCSPGVGLQGQASNRHKLRG
jgi:transposase InsO family protein